VLKNVQSVIFQPQAPLCKLLYT